MEETFDFAVIGAGPAGEAATYLARLRGASVAVIDRELFGGSCPFWACMPSKVLLHAAAVHAIGGDYDWDKASARRDYMISREGTDVPSDSGHVRGLESIGIEPADGLAVGPDLRIADGVFAVGAPAGPEMHTHLAHYQGELAVQIALGDDIRPDYSAIPRAMYTDPEVAGVGRSLEAALEAGIDAFEEVADLATSAKGYVAEATGHVTIVVDRKGRALVGAFIAGPAASEVIHEAVLAIKTQTSLDVLADTIHAFPTTARVMGGLFTQALRRLDAAV